MSIKSFAIRTVIAAAVVTTPLAAHAQFGGLFGGASKKSSGNVGEEVNKFMAAATDASNLTSAALSQLNKAITLKKDATGEEAARQAAQGTQGTKEDMATQAKQSTDASTNLLKEMNNKDTIERISKLDSAKKAEIAKSVFNYSLGVLRAKDVVPMGQNVIQSVSSSPMDLPKVVPVKDALPHLQQIGTTSVDLMKAIPTFFKATNITGKFAASKDEKADDNANFSS